MTLGKSWALSPVGRVLLLYKQTFPCHELFANSSKKSVQGWLPALLHLVRRPMDSALKDILLKAKCPTWHLLQWVPAVAQPICFDVPGLQDLSFGGWRNVPLCLNSHCSLKQERRILEKDSAELSLASLSPEYPGSTKTQCKKLSGHWEAVFYSFSLLLSTQGKTCWN